MSTNRHTRSKLLADALIEANRNGQEELAHNKQVERITAAVKAKLAEDAAKKAETSKRLSCPHCNEPLPEGWRTDDVTGVSDDNADNVNEQDDDTDDNDNREHDAKRKPSSLAQFLANHKHRIS